MSVTVTDADGQREPARPEYAPAQLQLLERREHRVQCFWIEYGGTAARFVLTKCEVGAVTGLQHLW